MNIHRGHQVTFRFEDGSTETGLVLLTRSNGLLVGVQDQQKPFLWVETFDLRKGLGVSKRVANNRLYAVPLSSVVEVSVPLQKTA